MTPIKIKASDIWQETELDRIIAHEFFGWRWLAFNGIPIRDTPGYPNETRVRQFFPPRESLGKQWQRWFAQSGEVTEADGTEPLSYRYCSSMGPHIVPHFSGHDNEFPQVADELKKRGKWGAFVLHLGKITGNSLSKMMDATPEEKCLAALAAIESKFVSIGEAVPA